MNRHYQQVPTTDGCRFELPNRKLGEFRKAGIFLMAFCGFGALILLIWSAIWLFIGISIFVEGSLFGLAVAAVSLVGFVGIFFACKFGTLGFYLWRDKTHCLVQIDPVHITSNERLGFFSWRRKFPIKKINRIVIEGDKSNEGPDAAAKLNIDPRLLTIRAYADNKSFLIAPGYGHEVLGPLIRDLGNELNRKRVNAKPIEFSDEVSKPKGNEVSTTIANAASSEPICEQPGNSKIEVYDYGGTDAYKVPPMGIWNGSKGLLGFSIAWNGFMILFTTVFLAILVGGGMKNELGWLGLSIFLLVSSVFWLVGIISLVSAVNAGRRSAMLGIADGQLFVERKSLFGTKWLEWPIDEIAKIAVGPSGTEINNVPVMELKIHDISGKQRGLLSQIPNDDLRWITQELNKALREI